jgi:hypothetical protein
VDFSIDKLKEKKGPLPLWAWIIVVAGLGYFGYTMFLKKPAPLPGNEQGRDPGEFESSQSVTKTDENGNQITSSYSARGAGTATGQMYYNAQQLQPQQGNVYVNLPAEQGQGAQAPNYLGRDQGFWFTLYRDMYPQEVAQQAYNSADYNGKPDAVSLAYNAIAIMLANPGVKPSGNNLLAKGTKLFIPGNPGATTGGSTWDDLTPEDAQPYKPGQLVPAPQSTREMRVA